MALLQQQARVLQRSDTAVHFYDIGRGPAVLLVHGWALDARVWTPMVAHLTPNFRVVSVDRRGSTRSQAAPNLVADAEDLVALLDHLELSRVIVTGMSQGARVALNLLALAPQRVGGLVLDGPPPDARLVQGDWPEDVNRALLVDALAEGGPNALRATVASLPLMQLHTSDPLARQQLIELLGEYRGADLAANVQRDPPALELARLQTLPCRVINGELDTPQRRAVGRAYVQALPRANSLVLQSAGHLACLDSPREYAAALREFASLTTTY
jgi:pimeloyl-ACP methyl ester carboxylesterase